jgi:hypothetical protein
MKFEVVLEHGDSSYGDKELMPGILHYYKWGCAKKRFVEAAEFLSTRGPSLWHEMWLLH